MPVVIVIVPFLSSSAPIAHAINCLPQPTFIDKRKSRRLVYVAVFISLEKTWPIFKAGLVVFVWRKESMHTGMNMEL